MFVYSSQEDIVNIIPVFPVLERLDCRGIIVTAKGNDCDFVSRFFGPKVGVPEDPVTGSAHTMLIPYWARVLAKNDLTAMQLSKRTGELRCKLRGERVEIAGRGKLYLTGEITVS
jgi:predicted PhzF superfamily epimerase YddE/YHI9